MAHIKVNVSIVLKFVKFENDFNLVKREIGNNYFLYYHAIFEIASLEYRIF